MSTTRIISLPEQRVRLSNISWETCLSIMGEEEHDGCFACDNGDMEIMTAGPEHEMIKGWDDTRILLSFRDQLADA